VSDVATGPGTDDGPGTVEDLLVRRLRQLGVTRTYGLALRGLDHVPVDDPDLAVLLADADGRIGHHDGSGRLGAATLAGPILHLSSAPGGRAPLQTIGSVEELVDALVDPPGLDVPGTMALHMDLDLTEPVEAVVLPSVPPERSPVLTLDPSLGGLRLLVLVGPGVVRSSSVDGLHSLARTAAAPVLATWGAIGVERWDSPFHAGVGGLQGADLALGGLDDADVVIASGLDPAEVGDDRLARLVLQVVPPRQLGALCRGWTPVAAADLADRPSVRRSLDPWLTPLLESDAVPLTGARAALHLAGALPDRGIAVADPGPAGFWVARAFPTSHPGSVCVPATVEPGFAAAAALVCRLDDRPCLAVTDAEGAASDATAAVVDLARSMRASLALQVWDVAAPSEVTDPAAHVDLLARHLAGTGVQIDPVPVDLSLPDGMVERGGPVVAWGDGGV
jgi:hypothetical protein